MENSTIWISISYLKIMSFPSSHVSLLEGKFQNHQQNTAILKGQQTPTDWQVVIRPNGLVS